MHLKLEPWQQKSSIKMSEHRNVEPYWSGMPVKMFLFSTFLAKYKDRLIKSNTLQENRYCLYHLGLFCILPVAFSFCSFGMHPPFSSISPFQVVPIIISVCCHLSSTGDSWLDITTQDLERMLEERSGGRADVGSQKSISSKQTQHVGGAEERRKEVEDDKEKEEAGYSLVAVSQGMKNFLNAMSSHEGAELPW